jgi:hypothetical protein
MDAIENPDAMVRHNQLPSQPFVMSMGEGLFGGEE